MENIYSTDGTIFLYSLLDSIIVSLSESPVPLSGSSSLQSVGKVTEDLLWNVEDNRAVDDARCWRPDNDCPLKVDIVEFRLIWREIQIPSRM